MLIFKVTLYFFSYLLLLAVLLPFIRRDFWVFRVFDYPRMQKFIVIGLVILQWLVFFGNSPVWMDWLTVSFLFLSFFYLFYIIFPFTSFSKPMIAKVEAKDEETINLLVSNVLQDNISYARVLNLIKKKNPDIVFLVETDKKWLEAVKELRENYPYHIEIPKENTYGLLFYSKLRILDHQVNFLIDPEIPSIIADVEFNKRVIRIFGLHPTPPVPPENDSSTDRDAEILLIGKAVKKYEGPCLVIGDLNDVAWSYTTELFLKHSGLLDPRRGRGIYSTFNANHLLLRWPLDHFFVSSHFRLVAMKVEKHIGSDHFPISICLVLSQKDDQEELVADHEDNALVEEKVQAGLQD